MTLGFLAPFVLTGKQVLLEICQEKIGWDDPIPDALRSRWERWRLQLPELVNVKVERCFKPNDFGNTQKMELHHFSDASLTDYGQCSYE
jgi:hypothetical protein